MIVLGRISAPFGIRGWVKIRAFGDDPASWAAMPILWVGAEHDWQPFELKELNAHGKGFVASFAGVEDRTAAERLTGRLIAAPRDALPKTAEDEFYWADLIGLRVVNTAGETLGTVTELISSGANEVLCVQQPGDAPPKLLPFVASVVKAVDREQGLIRVEWEMDW